MNTFIERPATAKSLAKRKLVHGFGVNDATYVVAPLVKGKRQWCPYYRVWANMLKRAYYSEFHARQPTYADVTVCRSWHVFSAFRAWMQRQPWEGNELDKDILLEGNKIYAPGACTFVDQRTNRLLSDHAAARGDWPIGVVFDKRCGTFMAKCGNDGGGQQYLGCFATPEQAHNAWRIAKSKALIEVAQDQPDPRVRDALLKRAAILQGCPR